MVQIYQYKQIAFKQVFKQTSIPQQINFIGKLEEDDGTKIFFITEKQQKIVLNFSLNLITLISLRSFWHWIKGRPHQKSWASSALVIKLCMSVAVYKVFQKIPNQDLTLLLTSSHFKTVIEVKCFYEQIKFLIYNEISL